MSVNTKRKGGLEAYHRVCAMSLVAAVATTAVLVGAGVVHAPAARAAGALSLSDTGHLHRTSHHGFTLNEEGSTSGTISGKIFIHLNIVSTNRVTAEVNIYPGGALEDAQTRP
jgi:hypothetical protein